jgi:phage FluMu protein Com
MSHREIKIKCPKCKHLNKAIAIDMGDKTIKCPQCGLHIQYKHRTEQISMTRKPERHSSSGLTFY